MNEEEKKAIEVGKEIAEKFKRLYLKAFNNEKITDKNRLSYLECALLSDFIEKLQKENELAKQALIKNCDIADKRNQLLKENKELKEENNRLKVIRYDIDYGTETVNLIPKIDLVEINMNKYMIEVEDGKFVDVKQIYKENETLKKLHIQDNVHLEFIMKHSILVQTIKNKIEKEIKYHEKNILDIENMTMLKSKTAKEEVEIEFNKYAIVVLNKMLQELIEESEEK